MKPSRGAMDIAETWYPSGLGSMPSREQLAAEIDARVGPLVDMIDELHGYVHGCVDIRDEGDEVLACVVELINEWRPSDER